MSFLYFIWIPTDKSIYLYIGSQTKIMPRVQGLVSVSRGGWLFYWYQSTRDHKDIMYRPKPGSDFETPLWISYISSIKLFNHNTKKCVFYTHIAATRFGVIYAILRDLHTKFKKLIKYITQVNLRLPIPWIALILYDLLTNSTATTKPKCVMRNTVRVGSANRATALHN